MHWSRIEAIVIFGCAFLSICLTFSNLVVGKALQHRVEESSITTEGSDSTGESTNNSRWWFVTPSANAITHHSTERKISYDGFQLWKTITDNDRTKLRVLAVLRDDEDITTWGGNTTSVDILVKPKTLPKVEAELRAHEIEYKVLIDDLQAVIENENPSHVELNNRQGHRLTWQAYHRLDDIYGYLDFVAETYTDICRLQTIGYSLGGKPIKLLKVSFSREKNIKQDTEETTRNAIWVDGGIHAREWISPATVTYFINYLTSAVHLPPSIRNIDWYIVPVLNPDGYEYTHLYDRLWRKNRNITHAGSTDFFGRRCVGTDLNRNFGYYWGQSGASHYQCRETFAGSGPFSESETRAVRDFILNHNGDRRFKAYLTFHSYGQYILYPWGYDSRVQLEDHEDLSALGIKMQQAMAKSKDGAYYRVGASATTLYPAAGGSDDWARGEAGIKYAYTIELRDTGRYGFILPAQFIVPTGNEALAAIQQVADAIMNL